MGIANGDSLPVAICTNSADTHEIKLVEKTIEYRFSKKKPKQLIGDRAYDSDPKDEELKKQKIELIAPHKRNRKKKKTQDGRKLRKYRKRWRVERLFAWIQNYRRCVTRYEYYEENFLGFVRWACIILLINNF